MRVFQHVGSLLVFSFWVSASGCARSPDAEAIEGQSCTVLLDCNPTKECGWLRDCVASACMAEPSVFVRCGEGGEMGNMDAGSQDAHHQDATIDGSGRDVTSDIGDDTSP